MDNRSDKISINILHTVHTARQTYGLRTGDHARYHAHTTRKIAALHRSTRTTAPNSKRKPRAEVSVSIEAAQKDNRLFSIILWESERAWSEGLRTREELAALETKRNPLTLARKRHRSAKRLLRASQHAQKLVASLRQLFFESEESSDLHFDGNRTTLVTASTLLQAEIYHLYMAGTHSFALASVSSHSSGTDSAARLATVMLSTAYVLLELFAEHAHRATEEALAFEMLDELEPMIRFSAYKADLEHNRAGVADIARKLGKPVVTNPEQPTRYSDLIQRYQAEDHITGRKGSRIGQSEAIRSIQWRDIDVPVRSAELSHSLGQIQNALKSVEISGQKSLPKTKGASTPFSTTHPIVEKMAGHDKAMATFDRALTVLSEAEKRARKLVEDNEIAFTKSHSTRSESASKPLSVAHSYIKFRLLSLRVQRDEVLLLHNLAKLHTREVPKSVSLSQRRTKSFGPIPTLVKRARARTFPILIKLLDSILQGLDQLRELDIVEDDGENLAGYVDTKVAFYKARRCFYLAQAYALVEKYPESILLFQQAALYNRRLRSSSLADYPSTDSKISALDSSASTSGISPFSVSRSAVSELESSIAKAEDRAKKDWFRYEYAQNVHLEKQKLVNSKLDEAVQSMSINASSSRSAGQDPKQKKAGPLFFDVAFNYVAGIDLEKIDKAASGQLESAPRAISEPTGMLKGTVMDEEEHITETAINSSSTTDNPSKSSIWGFFSGRAKR